MRKEEMAEREEKRKAHEDDEKENLKRKKLSPSKTQGKAKKLSLSLRKKAAALVVYRRRQWKYERISENQEIAVSKILTCEKDSFEVLPDTVKDSI